MLPTGVGLLLFVVALVLAVVPPSAGRMDIAVEDPSFAGSDPTVRLATMRKTRALGATYVRDFANWFELHPCRGQAAIDQVVANLDSVVTDARSLGMKVQMVLSGYAGDWGVPYGCSGVPATGIIGKDLSAYEEFIRTYVTHYAKLGVRRFSLWNEPNIGYLCPADPHDPFKCGHSTAASNGALYGRLYRAGYGVVQELKRSGAISKSVKILIGELASTIDFRFMDGMVKAGRLQADGFSYHPYQSCTPPNTQKAHFVTKNCRDKGKGISYAGDIKQKLLQLGKEGKLVLKGTKHTPLPLYMTEFGYFQQCAPQYATVGFCKDGLPENIRARWYVDALNIAKKHGSKEFVLFQFTTPAPGVWNTALLDSGGNPTGAYKAIWAWARKNHYPVQAMPQ